MWNLSSEAGPEHEHSGEDGDQEDCTWGMSTFIPGQTVRTNVQTSVALSDRYGTVLDLRGDFILVLLDGSRTPVLLRSCALVSASRPPRNLIDTLDA